jgi:hypothetical protein
MKSKLVHRFVIGTFVSLYLLVSVISTIHVIDFFKLSNPYWLAVSLAIAFELGAAASLASLIILDKMNKGLVWVLFAVITLMQMQGNMYYAFVNMEDFQGWSELFGLIEEEVIYQKRVLAAVSGAILPLVALGFIKSLVDYIKPQSESLPTEDPIEGPKVEEIKSEKKEEIYSPADLEESKEWDVTLEDGLEEESTIEESDGRDESHELDIVLNEMVEDLEINEPSYESNAPQDEQKVEETLQEDSTEDIQNEITEEESEIIEEETIEEETEEQEDLNSSLQDEEVEAILSGVSSDKKVVSGYYGDIVIDGNGVTTKEADIIPVNSNKSSGMIDSASKVYISPTRL